ncbi:hypothetical protein FQA47_002558 [Oryzias melastigma]|uniref:Uncharacterized protein n=1 Tax=Oryzias melastigma TaxID=30732 RepID=A0A834CEU7_ORYME|nr:hypothetical protein FQA47_002558 [Oryzias melastigma]
MNMSCSEEEETFRPEEGKPSAGGSEAFRPDPGSSVSKSLWGLLCPPVTFRGDPLN